MEGVRLAAVAAGVRYQDRLDLMAARVSVAAESDGTPRGGIAGVFTRSATRGAPVLWCEARLAARRGVDGSSDRSRPAPPSSADIAILVNAGNANAFTGAEGERSVTRCANAAAAAFDVAPGDVFVASTGVIGEPLPHERIEAKLGDLAASLASEEAAGPSAWEDAAEAIRTTDTYPKAAGLTLDIAGAPASISGIAKGSGMIAPDMATMLAFVFTDAAVAPDLLQRLLSDLTESTFNAITVDGDTSTSDTLLLAATGASDAPLIETPQSPGYGGFRRGLEKVLRDLAQQVVKDGEGLTKFVEIRVTGAKTRKAAKTIALSIANSPLVKTAFAGEDPNWGRIVMAVGKSGEAADRDKLSITLGPHPMAEGGGRSQRYDEETLAAYMKGAELSLSVDVGVGAGAATVWTSDLTHGYISINADYRS
ncbi:MAG: bifunctional glutamate N-acetyltransferase/amino-acid acetyltransferase ArgJ [Pseudomonadota bacterium]